MQQQTHSCVQRVHEYTKLGCTLLAYLNNRNMEILMHVRVCLFGRNKNAGVMYIYARVCAAARVFNVYESAGAMFLISLPAIPAAPISFLYAHPIKTLSL
jgi:hypothetical protein